MNLFKGIFTEETIVAKLNLYGYQVVVIKKTRKSRPKIIVDEEVIGALKEHKKTQDEVLIQLGDAYNNQDFIFAKMQRQYGYPIVIKNVLYRMKRLL